MAIDAKDVNDYIAGDTGDGGVLSPSTYMQNSKHKLLPTYNDPLPGAQFARSTFRMGASMPGDFGKYPELERGILLSDIAESPTYLNRLRGQAQDWSDQLANAVVGGVKSGLLTAVEDMSYLGDLNTYKSLFQMEAASSNWLADWAKQQKGFMCKDEKGKTYQMETDLFSNGEKIYSKDTVVFVPNTVNQMCKPSKKGDLPKGVQYFHEKRKSYRAYGVEFGKQIHLGYYNSLEEAVAVAKEQRIVYVNKLIDLYGETVEPKVFKALLEDKWSD